MTRIHKQESMLVESRFMWASIVVLVVVCGLMLRLWYIQIYRGDYYREVSERNRVRRIEIPAPRGIIFDRNGEVVLGNRPFYDLVYLRQYVVDKDTTFKIISRLLHVPVTRFEARLEMAQSQPTFLPIPLKRDLSQHEVSIIEANKIFLPGIEVRVAPRRDYGPDVPPHLLGYLKEIDPDALETLNVDNSNNPYLLGDLVGKQGIELRWEKYLRGQRGYSLIQVDSFGRQSQGAEETGITLPSVPAKPGADLELTIDYELQKTAKAAFAGKNGSVVVLNPQTGEVLAAVSEPGFDPKMMQQGVSPEDWRELIENPFKPLLDKSSGGEFAPGSVYKAVVAMAGLEEKVIDENRTFFCPGYYTLGDRRFYCYDRKGHGTVNLQKAIMKSCDVYFYQVGIELGVDRLARYAKAFGLGAKLGIALNMEKPGLIPTSAWKMLTYRLPWAGGDTPNISIGQGYDLVTPMQMANLYATIANGGKVWRPYYVNKVTNHVGETIYEHHPELIRQVAEVSPKTFELVRAALQTVVMDPGGTGKKAQVEGVTVAGKSGSVQVVSLAKNNNKGAMGVSMNWKEHAMFAAFSPTENAEIAVAVVSQNDLVGGGGKSAAPVAGAIIKRFWELKRERSAVAQALKLEEKHGKEEKTKAN
ncbi:MAG: penicillin-binding protein 2 [Chitinophagaceae bacterium]|nr:penicillin-binding protein 2 [Oligoflexus sp.]